MGRRNLLLVLGIVAFLVVLSLFLGRSEQGKIYSTKLSFLIFPDKKEETLKSLNMITVAKNEENLRFWLSVFGPETLMADLLSDAGGGSSLDCHQQAHLLGRIAYEVYGGYVFTQGNELCHSGYYHGAMEAFLKEKGTVHIADDMKTLCSSFPTTFGQYECYHGVGHGVMAYEDYDLPKALATCKKLPDDFSKNSCFGGAFMENILVANGQGAIPGHTTDWVNNDPHFPCTYFASDEALQKACYNMQTSRMLMLYGNNFDRVREECIKVQGPMKTTCFRSIGRDAAGVVLRDPIKIVHICKRNDVPDALVSECVIGALNVIIDFWGARLGGQASAFCRVMPGEQKTVCYNTLAKRLPELFRQKSEQEAVCKTFELDYQRLCLED